MDLSWAVAIGFGFALFFGAGALVHYALSARAYRKCINPVVTADDHRSEGERLIHLAVHTFDRDYERYLRTQAYIHFQSADIIENGPYKT